VSVENLTALVQPGQTVSVMMGAVLFGVLQLLIGIAAAIFTVSLAVNVLGKITPEFDQMQQLKKGNVAVAILMSGVLLAMSFVIRAGIAGLVNAVNPAMVALLFGNF
jgi:uncharacterized membrane protein YjfL (UPF0719 family)